MSTTFTAPARPRNPATPPNEPRRRSFTEQRRAARRAAQDRSLRAQLVRGRSLVQMAVASRAGDARWPFVAAFALIAGIAVVALLMVNTATAQTSFTENKLSSQLRDLTLTEQQLQQQVAAKQAPGELAKQAQQLGMQPGANPGNLVIGADGSVTWIEPVTPPPPAAPPAQPDPATPDATTPEGGAPVDAPAPATGATDGTAQGVPAQNAPAQDAPAQDAGAPAGDQPTGAGA